MQDDLKRFKMPRAGITLADVRAELVRRHNSTLPDNFVVKYEWGACAPACLCLCLCRGGEQRPRWRLRA